jgi:hypothetical protein
LVTQRNKFIKITQHEKENAINYNFAKYKTGALTNFTSKTDLNPNLGHENWNNVTKIIKSTLSNKELK